MGFQKAVQSEMETAQTTAPAELHHPSVPIRGTNSGGRPRIVLADDNADMRQYLSDCWGNIYEHRGACPTGKRPWRRPESSLPI